MLFDERRVIEELTKVLYEIVNDVVQGYVSQQARIKYHKDIRPRLRSRLNAVGIRESSDINVYRLAYKILKSNEILGVLREDPDKPREFITTKKVWNEYYRKYKLYLKTYSFLHRDNERV